MENKKMTQSRAFILIGIAIIAMACQSNNSKTNEVDPIINIRYNALLNHPLDSTNIPRSYTKETSTTRGVASRDWTSGFFPGNLWQIYRLTGQEKYMKRAAEWTTFIEKEKYNSKDHDIGFRIYPSFGNGYEITGNEHYKQVIIQSAKTLCKRYSPVVGAIRSWDFNDKVWEYPVIIDNMLNLELLFRATELTGDSSFYKIAVNHADKTLESHFRTDNSVFHVIDFDSSSGAIRLLDTHQGLHVNSSWARGQAWAIYGYTMTFRFTHDQRYLDQAMATAKFYLEHPNLPEDGIAYWDFDDPKIPNTHIDASASAVVCSALYEMFSYTNDDYYLKKANLILNSLRSEKYMLDSSLDIPFVLDYCTGNKPKEDELDEPIVYDDYYFLEALNRRKQIKLYGI